MRISDVIHDSAELGEFIRLLRQNHGLTLENLAKKADVSLNTISTGERGSNLNTSNVFKILDALGAELTINGVIYPPEKRGRKR